MKPFHGNILTVAATAVLEPSLLVAECAVYFATPAPRSCKIHKYEYLLMQHGHTSAERTKPGPSFQF